MDWFLFAREIRFASPIFMAASAALFLVLYFLLVTRSRSPIAHSYLAFFHKIRIQKRPDPLLWMYRTLPYLVALTLVLAVGNPMREEHTTLAQKRVPYALFLDTSGSLVSFDEKGVPILSFQDSMLNTVRLGVMRFTEEWKEQSEFFLMLYSDTPYAARYFAGGEEANIQIGELLLALPEDIQRWQNVSRKFFLQGTRTSFALEAGIRYWMSLPAEYKQSVFVLITDLEDTESSLVAKNIDSLIESGLQRTVYIVVLAREGNDQSISSFERSLTHKDSVRILLAPNRASLDAALHSIGESESPEHSFEKQVVGRKTLQPYFILSALFFMLIFVGIGELYVRRIP